MAIKTQAPPRVRVHSPAEQKLQTIIDEGKQRASRVASDLLAEAKGRVDLLVPPERLKFVVGEKETALIVPHSTTPNPIPLTTWAEDQVLDDMGIRKDFFYGLIDRDPPDRACAAAQWLLNDFAAWTMKSRRLIRVVNARHEKHGLVGGQVKGFLSEKYKPINQGEVVESFLAAAKLAKAVVVNGHVTDRRYLLECIHPELIYAHKGLLAAREG